MRVSFVSLIKLVSFQARRYPLCVEEQWVKTGQIFHPPNGALQTAKVIAGRLHAAWRRAWGANPTAAL